MTGFDILDEINRITRAHCEIMGYPVPRSIGEKTMIMRIRYEKRGGHVHCRLFTARGPNQTFALSGTLVFREDEWSWALTTFESGGAEVIPEGERSALA